MGVWNLYRIIQTGWPEPDKGRQNMENTWRDERKIGAETARGLNGPLCLSIQNI